MLLLLHKIMLNCFLLFLVTFTALVGAGRPPYRSDSLTKSSSTRGKTGLGIYGGTNATIEEHPYLVSIVFEGELYCVGVILSDSWILTLPLCVEYMAPSLLTVVAESSDGVTGVSYAVKDWITHPKFSGGTYMDYMFTLIQISGTFSWSNKTQAAKLPSKSPTANTQMEVTGWGATFFGDLPGTLQQGNMTWQTKKKCASLYSYYTSRTGCMYNKGNTTLCNGDFGVPAVNNGTVYAQFLVAYTSRSSGYCSADAEPELFSNIATVTAWIKKYTGAKYDYEFIQ